MRSNQPDADEMLRLGPRVVQMGAKGWGLVAGALIPAEALVAQYTGEVADAPEAERRAAAYGRAALRHTYIMTLQCAVLQEPLPDPIPRPGISIPARSMPQHS